MSEQHTIYKIKLMRQYTRPDIYLASEAARPLIPRVFKNCFICTLQQNKKAEHKRANADILIIPIFVKKQPLKKQCFTYNLIHTRAIMRDLEVLIRAYSLCGMCITVTDLQVVLNGSIHDLCACCMHGPACLLETNETQAVDICWEVLWNAAQSARQTRMLTKYQR